jgi:bifunctional UDP-N-acetylglucosamine pyrophosphorylase/glucosamine-1-phosphate N-acetyltransferase/UDP-N-acetylglucosamine pyrophosphorylase
MSAIIIVLNTPYFATSQVDGKYQIANVPPGEYRLQVMHERATQSTLEALTRHVTVGEGPVMVVAGDSPLIQSSSVQELMTAFHQGSYACLLGTLIKDQPFGLGRIVRDAQGHFQRIVEQKDATPEEQSICEVNMSTYLFDRASLLWALEHLKNNNAQAEYYLTDCPELLLSHGKRVDALVTLKPCESLSINTIDELGLVESKMKELGYPCAN